MFTYVDIDSEGKPIYMHLLKKGVTHWELLSKEGVWEAAAPLATPMFPVPEQYILPITQTARRSGPPAL